MKDNLFEMLLNLFETSLSRLQENHKPTAVATTDEEKAAEQEASNEHMVYLRNQHDTSTRVFTYEEQMKLTKASYQFLVRMKLWHILDDKSFEEVMDQVQFSDSRIITLQETKWIIRNVLSSYLDEEQLAFLDLVLYQSEDELTLH